MMQQVNSQEIISEIIASKWENKGISSAAYSLMSLENGIGRVAQSTGRTPSEILNLLPAEDLLYLSLVQSIPADFYEHSRFIIDAFGINFMHGRRTAGKSPYIPDFERVINYSRELALRPGQPLETVSSAIFSYFSVMAGRAKNIAALKKEKYHSSMIETPMEKSNATESVHYAAERTENPSAVKNSKHILFTPTGILYSDNPLSKIGFAEYDAKTLKAVTQNFLNQDLVSKDLTSEEFRSYQQHALKSIFSAAISKSSELPDSSVGAIDIKARQIKEKYGLAILMHGYCLSQRECLTQRFTIDELDTLEKICGVLNGNVLSAFDAVSPWFYHKRDDGTIETARQLFTEANTKFYTSHDFFAVSKCQFPENMILSFKPHSLRLLKSDFEAYLPNEVTSAVLHFLSARGNQILQDYSSVASQGSEKKIVTMSAFGFKPKEAMNDLIMADFVQSAREYILSGFYKMQCPLDTARIKYFDSLFRKRIAAKP